MPRNAYITFVKKYSAEHNCPYAEAMKAASVPYRSARITHQSSAKYASMSKMKEALEADAAGLPRPLIYEKLIHIYNRPDFKANIDNYAQEAIRKLEAVDPKHFDSEETEIMQTEFVALKHSKDNHSRIRSFERVLGIRPRRHYKDQEIYTYTNPLTPYMEHYTMLKMLHKLKGTQLGEALLGSERSKKFKPKHIISLIKHSPFDINIADGSVVGNKTLTGAEWEHDIIKHLYMETQQRLLPDFRHQMESNAEEFRKKMMHNAPAMSELMLIANISEKKDLKRRLEHYASLHA